MGCSQDNLSAFRNVTKDFDVNWFDQAHHIPQSNSLSLIMSFIQPCAKLVSLFYTIGMFLKQNSLAPSVRQWSHSWSSIRMAVIIITFVYCSCVFGTTPVHPSFSWIVSNVVFGGHFLSRYGQVKTNWQGSKLRI